MRGVVSVALLLTLAPLAPLGRAAAQDEPVSAENAFTGGFFEVGSDDVHVVFDAARDIGEPRVRTDSGFVRVWFPDMVGWSNIDLEGDGGAVRFVRARPGADDTGVVIIRVGDLRRVPESSVGIVRAGAHVTVTIPRSVLPAAHVAAPPAPAATRVPTPEAQAEADAEADVVAPAPPIVPAPLASAEDARSAADALAAQDGLTGAATQTPLATLGVPASEGRSSLLTLLAITVLLGGALAAVRYWQSRRPGAANAPSIRIVASTRLSPKQQLIVVRALGQDHLIAIEPGRTERLLSIASPEPTREEEIVPELRLSQPVAPSAHAPTMFGAALAPAGASLGGTAFGRELLRLVEAKTDAPIASSATPMTSSPSEAVAGLVRLRARAGAR